MSDRPDSSSITEGSSRLVTLQIENASFKIQVGTFILRSENVDAEQIFEAALGIAAPWYIKGADFDAEQRCLSIHIDFVAGTRFAYPGGEGAHPVHDTQTKRHRHLNFSSMNVISKFACRASNCRMGMLIWSSLTGLAQRDHYNPAHRWLREGLLEVSMACGGGGE